MNNITACKHIRLLLFPACNLVYAPPGIFIKRNVEFFNKLGVSRLYKPGVIFGVMLTAFGTVIAKTVYVFKTNHIVVLFGGVLFLGTALVLLLIAIMPTMSSGFSSQTISFIIIAGSSALVILTHILVEEVIREGSLIPYVLHFSLCDVAPAIMTEPIAWSGLLCVLATRATALVYIFARVVPRSYHVDAE